jgi:hypothetical protein
LSSPPIATRYHTGNSAPKTQPRCHPAVEALSKTRADSLIPSGIVSLAIKPMSWKTTVKLRILGILRDWRVLRFGITSENTTG